MPTLSQPAYHLPAPTVQAGNNPQPRPLTLDETIREILSIGLFGMASAVRVDRTNANGTRRASLVNAAPEDGDGLAG